MGLISFELSSVLTMTSSVLFTFFGSTSLVSGAVEVSATVEVSGTFEDRLPFSFLKNVAGIIK